MLRGSYYVAAREEYKPPTSNYIKCQILLLDGNLEYFTLQKKALGQYLLDFVFDTLSLLERDFFGLQFKESHPSSGKYYKWLNGAKSIKTQLTGSQPYNFQFKVKFYPTNPNQMKEEYTRYLLFLQLKKDMLEDKLYCNQEMMSLLASYALQSEIGDYNPQKHKSGYVSEFRFSKTQTSEMEQRISDLHMKLKNMSPSKAEKEYLNTASQLNYYGVDVFNAMTADKEIVQIGPSSMGFNVFKNKQKIHMFLWSAIFKISFKKKKITIQIKSSLSKTEGSTKTNALINTYSLSSFPLCKTLWQNCVDYHTFFRVKFPSNNFQLKTGNETITNSNNKPKGANFFGISIKPSFACRRTMPSIEDIQKRSRTSDRTFIRTPSTKGKQYLSRNNSNNHSNMSYSSTVSRSSGTLSSLKLNESKKIHLLTKFNSFQNRSQSQSQNSLDYKPLAATFDSDNSSFDDVNDIRTDECKDSCPDSGTFFLSDNILTERRDKDRTMSCERNSCRTYSSSPLNYHFHKRSIDLNKNSRFRIFDKSIDESSSNISSGKILNSNASMDSLSEIKDMCEEKRIPYFTRLASSVNFHKLKPQVSTNGSRRKVVVNRSNSVDRSFDNDLQIKLHCDRNRRYGFTVRCSSDRGSPIIINSIGKNTPADTCFPRLNVGDQLLSINGENVDQFSQEEVISMIKKSAETGFGDVILCVRPANYMADCSTIESPSDWDFSINGTFETKSSPLLSSKLDPLLSSIDSFKQSLKNLEITVENDEILQQFESVYRKKPGLTMIEAKKTENFNKNRYRDISPYDQTRVILRNNSSSDYINASIINMQINDNGLVNRYIAAQGPLLHTSEDFWHMCWEQDTRLIVMLTALSEQGRPKCHKYWPNIYETVEFGDYQISCLVEEYSEDGGFATRDLMLYRTVSREERKIQHMQYISWPDHGVPAIHYEFINFVYQVRKFRSVHVEPVVVHCSAGIGRTGVLITMETAMCLIEAKKALNLVEILRTMRDQRASMIQTPAQFKFVCEAILKVYKDSNSDIRAL